MVAVAGDATSPAKSLRAVVGSGAAGDAPRARARWPRWTPDALVCGVFLLGGGYLTAALWRRPDRMVFSANDEVVFEWMLAHSARFLTHLENPLFSTQINAPDGVNLMANTSVLGLGVPLAPVTLLFGPHVAFLTGIMISFAGTAIGWYFVLRSLVVSRRVAAFVGGAFCGFAPGMVSQASGHLNLVAQFAIPWIIWAVCRSGRAGRTVHRGAVLGVLVAYQFFLSEELLLFVAIAVALFVGVYAVANRPVAARRARSFVAGLGVAALVAGALLAYPVWFQFFGPQHYRGLPYAQDSYFMDVDAYATYARRSLTGFDVVPGLLSPNPSEENAFFGLSLLALCLLIIVWLWRSPVVKALSITAVFFALLSLGPTVQIGGKLTRAPGPLRLVSRVPLIDLAVPARFPLVVATIIGVLLAMSVDRVAAAPASAEAPVRLLWLGAVVAVLLPLAPLPLRTYPSFPQPAFVRDGVWRRYVSAGQTVIAVPPTQGRGSILGMYWSARRLDDLATPGGYFIGPSTPTDDTGRYGAFERPTAALLGRVADTGQAPVITDAERRQAVSDLRHWHGAVLVLAAAAGNEDQLRRTVDELVGPGRKLDGAWVWDVRPLVGG